MQAIQRLRRRSSGSIAASVGPPPLDSPHRTRPSLETPPQHPSVSTTEIHNSDGKGKATVSSLNPGTGDSSSNYVPSAISTDQDGGAVPEESSTTVNNALSSGGGDDGLANGLDAIETKDRASLSVNRKHRSHDRGSLTDRELQQVLGPPQWNATTDVVIGDDGAPTSKKQRHMIQAPGSSTGAMLVGSSKPLGGSLRKQEEMAKFFEHAKAQSSVEYVPRACAEKILKQVHLDAEETKIRHQDVMSTLEATYHQIDENTRRHYSTLIVRLQMEMRVELRRLAKERKEQDELVENLRDKIATVTAEAAAREAQTAEELNRERQERAKEAGDAVAQREAMTTETKHMVEVLTAEAREERAGFEILVHSREEEERQRAEADSAVISAAKQESAAIDKQRIAEGRRKSMQRQELEATAARSCVALVVESLVNSVEHGEYERGQTSVINELSITKKETRRLRAELVEASHAADSIRAHNAELKAEVGDLRKQALAEASKAKENGKMHLSQGAAAATEDCGESEVWRARLERMEEERMIGAEDSCMAAMDLVRYRRGARQAQVQPSRESKPTQESAAIASESSAGGKELISGNASERRIAELQAENVALKNKLLDNQVSIGANPAVASSETKDVVMLAANESPKTRTVEQVKEELRSAVASRKKVKDEIKVWLKEFEEREGRPASNEDKLGIREMFVAHKRLERSTAQLTSELQALEAEAETKKNSLQFPRTADETAIAATSPGGGTATGAESGNTATVIIQTLREENASLRVRLAAAVGDVGSMDVVGKGRGPNDEGFVTGVGRVLVDTEDSRAAQSAAKAVEDATAIAAELQEALQKSRQEQVAASEDAQERERDLEESLRKSEKEAQSAALELKKSEHLKEEALAALEVAREEMKVCQLVVDEGSEAARLREQVAVLKTDLDAKSRAATAGWDAAAGGESDVAAAEARGLRAGVKRGRSDAEKKIRALKEALAAATAAKISATATIGADTTATAVAEPQSGSSPNNTDAVSTADEGGDTLASRRGDGSVDAESLKLKNAERELENLRERTDDARGEAERATDELQRVRTKYDEQREREADLVSAVAALEKEKEVLSRGLVLAEERASLAAELVAAQKEDATHARQEAALSAAQVRRVSREQGLSPPQRVAGGRPPISSTNRRNTEQLRLAAATLVHAVKDGTELWKAERRTECHALYVKAGTRAATQMPPGQAQDDLRVALTAARGLNPAKAAVALRKAFDTVIEAAMVAKETVDADREERRAGGAVPKPASTSVTSKAKGVSGAAKGKKTSAPSDMIERDPPDDQPHASGESSKLESLQRQFDALTARQHDLSQAAAITIASANTNYGGAESETLADGGVVGARLAAATQRCAEMEDRIDELEAECRGLQQVIDDGPPVSDTGGGSGDAAGTAAGLTASRNREQLSKIRVLEKKNREEEAKVRKLEAQCTKLEAQCTKFEQKLASPSVGSDKQSIAKEKAASKAAEDAKKKSAREIQKINSQLETASQGWESCKSGLQAVQKERDDLKRQVASMGAMDKELEGLRARAEEATQLGKQLEEATTETERIQGLYQSEQVLRKKYWNLMEDMKGKIRVFVRCRPMAKYELDRKCERAVRFLDEATVEVAAQHGPKQFVFDNVFSEQHSQADVFEDTRRLVQSAIDGYNVCVFAYGQTGSGKTWTMTGGDGDNQGLIPRAIGEIYGNIEKAKGSIQAKVSCYFVELYLDNIRDLFFAMDRPRDTPPKLDIKLDANKMVFLKNVVIKDAPDAQELSRLFTLGNAQRKVGGTKMNAESSRSHSIFSVLLEVTNRTTRKMSTGKLSLVDLAGSERADKTGATADRLKEAQSINKSLSALGDVISALSTGEKFVPYRNNKLTQMMQDSLGGNAKTLMFVNISPADYNQDETATALTYATRVKSITNTANKNQDGEEIAKLKEMIRKLKAGEDDEGDGGGAA